MCSYPSSCSVSEHAPSLACATSPVQADVTEVKAMKNPPAVVKLVMETVCHMLGVKPKKMNDPANPSKKIDDYWGPSQGILSDPKLLDNLKVGR